jgi:hypothetical protein
MVDVQKKIESRLEEIRKEFSELSFALKVCQRFAIGETDYQKGGPQDSNDSLSSKPLPGDLAGKTVAPEAAKEAA